MISPNISPPTARGGSDVRALLGELAANAWWIYDRYAGKFDSQKRLGAPVAILAELTHRCPLGCPYCSNRSHLIRARTNFRLGLDPRFLASSDTRVLHANLSGGEPAARQDLTDIIAHCANVGYTPISSPPGSVSRRTRQRTRASRARPRAAFDSGFQRRVGRPDRRLQGRLRPQLASRMDHAGCLPLTSMPSPRANIFRAEIWSGLAVQAWRAAGSNRAYAILRLGAHQSRRAHALADQRRWRSPRWKHSKRP